MVWLKYAAYFSYTIIQNSRYSNTYASNMLSLCRAKDEAVLTSRAHCCHHLRWGSGCTHRHWWEILQLLLNKPIPQIENRPSHSLQSNTPWYKSLFNYVLWNVRWCNATWLQSCSKIFDWFIYSQIQIFLYDKIAVLIQDFLSRSVTFHGTGK